MATYAYVRVSTKEQNTDRQMLALRSYNLSEKHIFCDRQSGKDFARPEYQRVLRKLRPGDLLLVKSIDRLGRNYNDILVQWQYITKTIGADIRVLDMDLLDTRRKEHDLTGTLIADLVLQILAYVAQTERENIRQRQAEGIAAAKARGQKVGRKRLPLPKDFPDICQEYCKDIVTSQDAAAKAGMSQTTFLRRYREWEKAHGEKAEK